MTGLDAGTGGKLLSDARASLRAETETRAKREKLRDRRMLLGSVILSVVTLAAVLGVGVPVVLPLLSERTSEVADRVVQDARAQRADVGRRELGEANTQLILRDLPTIADPGNTATGDELLIAAATARVLAILPESTVGRLRDDVLDGRVPAVLPSLTRAEDLPLGDRVVEVLPDPSAPGAATPSTGASATSTRPRPATPGRSPTPPAQRAPVPDPPAPRPRGLLEPCVAGAILC